MQLKRHQTALQAATESLRRLEADLAASASRTDEVLEVLRAALPPELPDSVRGLLDQAYLQAVHGDEVPRQISKALEAEVAAALQAGRAVKERL